MTKQERTIGAIARACHLRAEEISADATFEQLGVDSLTGLQIVFELEEEFKITIPENVAMSMGSVHDVIDRLAGLVGTASV
jgi:acyl carrier protein